MDYDTKRGGVWVVSVLPYEGSVFLVKMVIMCHAINGGHYLNHEVSPRTRRDGADSSSCIYRMEGGTDILTIVDIDIVTSL